MDNTNKSGPARGNLSNTSAITTPNRDPRLSGRAFYLFIEESSRELASRILIARELLARVKALLRRSRMPSWASTEQGPLVIDPEARTVHFHDELIEFTPREYDLLRTLAQAPGKNFTREELLDRVWGPEYLGDLRRVDNYISRIRGKLKGPERKDVIRSVWGVGYRMES